MKKIYYRLYQRLHPIILFLNYLIVNYIQRSNSLESESSTLIKEPDRIVALPIPEKENPSLNDCIQLYCQSEKLDGDNKWFDEKNNKKVGSRKKNKDIVIVQNIF